MYHSEYCAGGYIMSESCSILELISLNNLYLHLGLPFSAFKNMGLYLDLFRNRDMRSRNNGYIRFLKSIQIGVHLTLVLHLSMCCTGVCISLNSNSFVRLSGECPGSRHAVRCNQVIAN